jgi:predicted amidohydrolase
MARRAVVAAAQFAPTLGDPAANTQRAVAAVTEAASLGACLVVLQEFAGTGWDPDWARTGFSDDAGEPIPGPTIQALAAAHTAARVAVMANVLERDGQDRYSTSVLLAAGEVLAVHRKTQVTAAEEAAGLRAGDRRAVPVALPGLGLRVAPMICFEHGFPEIALSLALDGAELIAISSHIAPGTESLRELRTRARAQDNGAYVVAANAAGAGSCGASLIVDPHGEVVARGPETGPAVITASIDPAMIEEARAAEPVLARRRPGLYPPR